MDNQNLFVSVKTENELDEKEMRLQLQQACESLENLARPANFVFESDIKRTNAMKKDYAHYKRIAIEE